MMENRGGEEGKKARKGMTKPRQVCSQGLRLWKTNLETLSHKISIKDTKPRGPEGPLKRGGQCEGSQRLHYSSKIKTA